MNTSFKLAWVEFKQLLVSGNTFREVETTSSCTLIMVDSGVVFYCVIDKHEGSSDQADYELNFKAFRSNISDSSRVIVSEQPPFAKPDYRTKRDGSPNWIDVQENESLACDYVAPEELFVSGGECIALGAKKGDWIKAQVVDVFGYIPELYRAALTENYPVVAEYVIRANLVPSDLGTKYVLDTYPLNAKITPGLVLRVIYNASAEVGVRNFTTNYYLTKKITP